VVRIVKDEWDAFLTKKTPHSSSSVHLCSPVARKSASRTTAVDERLVSILISEVASALFPAIFDIF
jgi:hypothetical protein